MITDDKYFKSRDPKSGISYPLNSHHPEIGYGMELKPKAAQKIQITATDHFIGGLYSEIIKDMKLEEYNAEPVQVSSRIPLVIKENILYPKTKKAIRYGSTINLEDRNKNTIEQNQWASPGKMKYIKEHLISRHVKNQSY